MRPVCIRQGPCAMEIVCKARRWILTTSQPFPILFINDHLGYYWFMSGQTKEGKTPLLLCNIRRNRFLIHFECLSLHSQLTHLCILYMHMYLLKLFLNIIIYCELLLLITGALATELFSLNHTIIWQSFEFLDVVTEKPLPQGVTLICEHQHTLPSTNGDVKKQKDNRPSPSV